MYINSGPTTTSTTTTTTHILDPKVDDALDKISVLESELSTVTKVMELAKTTAFENQAAVETMGERLQVANDLIANATEANAKLAAALEESEAKLAGAVASAASNAAGVADNADAIESNAAMANDNGKAMAGLAKLAAALKDVGTLVATPQGCSATASCAAPTVAADGADMMLAAAKGKVVVNTKECGDVDLCQLAQAVEQIKEGLKNLV